MGSCALSYYLSTMHPKKFKYIINDTDENLITLVTIMKDKEKLTQFTATINEVVKTILDKESYNKLTKKNDDKFLGWFISNLIYNFHAGLYNPKYKPRVYDFSNIGIVQFLQNENVVILNKDGYQVFTDNMNDKTTLMFIDPPYLMSQNLQYNLTNTIGYGNIYEYCSENNIKTLKSRILFCLEDNWIIRLLYKKHIKTTHVKQYSTTRKKTNHLIIANF
jgi:site-specific DNA-adenine methylase